MSDLVTQLKAFGLTLGEDGKINKLGGDIAQPSSFSTFNNIAGGVGSLADAWLGFQNLGLARDSFQFNKNLAQTNLANQATLANQSLAAGFNQAQAQNEAGRMQYSSLDEYMKKNAVKGTI